MMIYYSQQWSDAKKTLKSPGGVQSFLEYRKYWVKAIWLKRRFVHFILLIFELTDQFLQENVSSRHLPNKKLYLWLDGDLPSMKWRIGLILSLSNDVSIIFFFTSEIYCCIRLQYIWWKMVQKTTIKIVWGPMSQNLF